MKKKKLHPPVCVCAAGGVVGSVVGGVAGGTIVGGVARLRPDSLCRALVPSSPPNAVGHAMVHMSLSCVFSPWARATAAGHVVCNNNTTPLVLCRILVSLSLSTVGAKHGISPLGRARVRVRDLLSRSRTTATGHEAGSRGGGDRGAGGWRSSGRDRRRGGRGRRRCGEGARVCEHRLPRASRKQC